MNHASATSDSPQVIAPPPFIYGGGLAAGIIMNFIRPAPFLPEHLVVPLGVTLILISVFLISAAIRAFARAGTNVDVRKPSTTVVEHGPYRFSRNPLYLAMTLFVAGVGAWLNALWVLAALVPALLVIRYGVIRREEAYLTKKFGEEYLRYKTRVRRWL